MTTHLNLTPWARNALTAEQQDEFDARAAALGAHVFATNSQHSWTVHATGVGVRVARYHVKGSLAVAIENALEEFAVEQKRADAELADLLGLSLALDYTNEELGRIYAQSKE